MRRVVKVGGSLLTRKDLVSALPRWLESQGKAETLIIVGGGALIDAIRHLEEIRRGDPVETHWTCVGLLETTHRIFSQWFDWPCIGDAEELRAASQAGFSTSLPTLIAVNAFYAREQTSPSDLSVPQDWCTTTDTIAGLLAQRVAADELVLLKSCEVDPTLSVTELSRRGIIDEAFPLIASRLRTIRVERLP